MRASTYQTAADFNHPAMPKRPRKQAIVFQRGVLSACSMCGGKAAIGIQARNKDVLGVFYGICGTCVKRMAAALEKP